MKVLTIAGTRPEMIKLAPVIVELDRIPGVESTVCFTGQHREMLAQSAAIFGIRPDIDLGLMTPDQTLNGLASLVVSAVDAVLAQEKPDVVLLQGDTTTVAAAAMAAFNRNVPIGHVEAGLRSGDMTAPFPEEGNRRIAGALATYHFAPTCRAVEALIAEGIDRSQVVHCGNTVIDALHMILDRPRPKAAEELLRTVELAAGRRLALVTAHRRENFGSGIRGICEAIALAVQRDPELVVAYPVHPNPNIRETVDRLLGDLERVHLLSPLDYDVMVSLIDAAYLVLTDSGGIQEEAAALGTPTLVLRDTTERVEGVDAGAALLVGTDSDRITAEVARLTQDRDQYRRMSQATQVYGDGRAARRIVDHLVEDDEELAGRHGARISA